VYTVHRWTRRLTAFALVAAVLAACTSDTQGTPVKPSPSAQPTSVQPAADEQLSAIIERFGKQKLSWGRCGRFASSESGEKALGGNGLQCARLRVPLDYAEPDGTAITIGVLRKKASQPAKRIGSLITNPGGPGASGVEAAASVAEELSDTMVGKRFDIVGFDPRGIGSSRPTVRCLSDRERDAERADDSDVVGSKASVARQVKQMRTFVAKCVARTKYGKRLLANVGTREVVKDMDVLRAALRDEKLTYLGYSYGTRIGYVYASMFGDNVRAMVLDGAVDPEQDFLARMVEQAKAFGKSFDKFAEWCARQASCALGSDPAKATQRYRTLVRPLIRTNVPLADGRSLSYVDAITATTMAMYSDETWPFLKTGLADLAQGRGELLMDMADFQQQRGKDGTYSPMEAAGTAVRCVDRPPVTDPVAVARAVRQANKAAPYSDPGGPVGNAPEMCALWPVEHTLEPGLADLTGVPPVLVISTTGDPATPHRWGIQLAKAMDGRLLTFTGKQHTVFGSGNKCVDQAGVAYLLYGSLPTVGTRCKPS